MNITLEDCIALCGLDESEVAAIAEHEHIPQISAAALAQNLLGRPGSAMRRKDIAHARELLTTLRHFLAEHRNEL